MRKVAVRIMTRMSLRGLRGRFLLVTGTLFLSSTLVLATFHLYQSRTTLLHELEKRGYTLSQNLAYQAVHAFREEDSTEFQQMVASLCGEEDVRYVMIQDDRGRIVAQGHCGDFDFSQVRPALVADAWAPAVPGLVKVKMGKGKLLYNFSAPVWENEVHEIAHQAAGGATCERLGTVRLGLCTAPTLSRIERAFLASLAFGLAVCLVGLVGTMLITRWTLKPLRQMAAVAKAVTQGDLSRRVEVRSGDEIGSLGQAFNEMTESLAASQEKLAGRHEELEAAALEQERLYQETKLRATRLRVLNELSRAMAVSLEAEEIYNQLHGQLPRLMQYEYITVLRYLGSANSFRRDFVWVDRPELEAHVRGIVPGELPLFDHVRRTEAPRSAANFHDDPLLADGWLARNGFKSGFLVPIMARGEFLGVLGMASRRRDGFSRTEIATTVAIADNMGLVLKNADLYHRLQRSFVELKEAQEQLAHSENTRNAEKLRSVGQMASGVAHDFNNVLAAIIGRVQLLRMKHDRGNLGAEDLTGSLAIMERAALDGAETVRRIQEFSRDRGGRPDLVRADLNNLVREAVEITRPRWKTQAEQNGVRVEVRLHLDSVPQVPCVPSEIREVLTNFIFNAVDALPEGGVITLSTRPDDEGVVLAIADNGVGMPPEVRDRIFEPFFTTKGVKGSGLGLSIVFGIIERHGGTIRVEENEGGGTRFEIHLPVAQAALPAGSEEPMLRAEACRVLVGDDEANVRQTLVELLIALGNEVEEVGSGREILERFEPGRFDVVFTDLGMPDMSGWDVARAIRKRDRAVPIILVTGWGNQITTSEAEERGVTRVLAKPFTVQKVSSLLAEIQNQRRAA
jgi:signal transduction histidine kinase/CheY-like chemotaxis protein